MRTFFTPLENICAVKNRDVKVHNGTRAAWQATNMKKGRSISIFLLSASNLFPVHGHFMADQQLLVKTPVAELKTELRSIVALPASLTTTSMPTKHLQVSLSPSQHSASASSGCQSNQEQLFSHCTTLCYPPLLEYQRRHPPLRLFCCSAGTLVKI